MVLLFEVSYNARITRRIRKTHTQKTKRFQRTGRPSESFVLGLRSRYYLGFSCRALFEKNPGAPCCSSAAGHDSDR